jgi:hypothetical protein
MYAWSVINAELNKEIHYDDYDCLEGINYY